jgi:predicted PurR-regulated permease PerM
MAGTIEEAGPSNARRAFETTVVAVATIVAAIALWKLKVLVALLLAAFAISAAIRPGVEWLASRRVPRPLGVLLHYLILLGLLVLLLAFVVPRLVTEVQTALNAHPHTGPNSGIKDRLLAGIETRLHHLPAAGKLVHPALTAGEEAMKVLIAVLFTLAAAAYWVFERDRAVDLVAGLLPRPKRKKLRDTWELVDAKLGAFIRGQCVMITLVCTLSSIVFVLVGEPYWLLLGIMTGILEIVPVVGPAAAMVLAAGAGLTVSWHVAALAVGGLLILRLFQDYVISPRVLGGAVGLPPLIVLVSVFAVTLLLGGFYVLLSVPIAALVVTVVDVVVRGVDPAEEEVPPVLFPAKDAESA